MRFSAGEVLWKVFRSTGAGGDDDICLDRNLKPFPVLQLRITPHPSALVSTIATNHSMILVKVTVSGVRKKYYLDFEQANCEPAEKDGS